MVTILRAKLSKKNYSSFGQFGRMGLVVIGLRMVIDFTISSTVSSVTTSAGEFEKGGIEIIN